MLFGSFQMIGAADSPTRLPVQFLTLLAVFVGGLIFMTYALTLRGDVMSEFGKPGSKTAAPPSGASAPAPASAPASAPAPAEKK